MSQKCYSCSHLDTFNCCCSKKPIMMCVSDLAEHDKQIRDEVIEEFVKLVIDFGVSNGYVDAESFMDLAEQMKGEQND